jgi:hypothetical protein
MSGQPLTSAASRAASLIGNESPLRNEFPMQSHQPFHRVALAQPKASKRGLLRLARCRCQRNQLPDQSQAILNRPHRKPAQVSEPAVSPIHLLSGASIHTLNTTNSQLGIEIGSLVAPGTPRLLQGDSPNFSNIIEYAPASLTKMQ